MYEEAQDNIYDLRLENDLLHQEIDELKNSHPGGRRKKTAQEKQAVIDYIAAGHSQKETAAHFGMSSSTVYNILLEAGRVNARK